MIGLMLWDWRRRNRWYQQYLTLAKAYAGLTVTRTKNFVGMAFPPVISGTWQGRQVKIQTTFDVNGDLYDHAVRFRQWTGKKGPSLRKIPNMECTWIQVGCANPKNMSLYVATGLGTVRGKPFNQAFAVGVSQGHEAQTAAVLTGPLQKELLDVLNEKFLSDFETFALIGNSLIYIESGRPHGEHRVARLGRMLDTMIEVGNRVDAA